MEVIFYNDFDFEKSIPKIEHPLIWKRFEGVYYLFDYKEKNISDMIWQMKFKNNEIVPIFFGKVLSKNIRKIGVIDDDFILIPIPIHYKRREERGFNQCERLCEEINSFLRIKYRPNIFIRNKYTTKQSWSNKKDRQNNLNNVFEVSKDFKKKINGQKIILIDDVITTGSTIKEARRTLLRSGASSVVSIVIAH